MAGKKKKETESLDVVRVTEEAVTFCVLGVSPFVCNAMSAKARQGLLFPPKKKSKSEKESTLKHEPMQEFVRSAYRSQGDDAEARIEFPAAGFKRAMASAALELPGVNKSQIGRLCWVDGHMVPLFGIPQLWMAMVRQAGLSRTPDVRTRAIIPEWAARVTIRYVTPNLNLQAVGNLLASAGVFIGVGDGRPEKGALSFGRFELVSEDDERYQRLLKTGGREAQDAAFENPTFFDTETEELLDWWDAETRRRGFKVV